VSLEVYNIVGKVIRTLINDVQSGGEQFVRWDGKDERGRSLESGVYLYKLAVNGVESTKKMSLLK
jgi:flagellar hook assembly protein FlgD